MWKVAACFFGVASATPDRLVCNDPRFDPGSVIMGHPIVEGSPDFTVDTTNYANGNAITVTWSGLGRNDRVALRALPKYGYSGHYGSFSQLSSPLQLLCVNTVSSTKGASSGTLTWTPHSQTYGDVDITLLYGTSTGLSYKTITLNGPPIPSTPPAWSPSSASVARRPGNVPNETTSVSVSTAASPCVAPADGSYNLPNAPVFHQMLKSKTVVFPAGQCVPCRDDFAEKCLSARVECPKQPGELAVQHLFTNEDCSGEASSLALPTRFVHCPGPDHYSPDRLDLERFVKKLQRDHAAYFPDENTTRLALAEYRRMLHIIQRFPEMPAVPSKLVDLVWHEHILDTQSYRHDSQRLFGKYIHHAPSFGDDADEDVKAEKLGMVDQQREMLEQYLELFGEPPNAEIWPLAKLGTSPAMGEGRLPDCCKAACVKVNCVTCVGCNAVDCGKLSAESEVATLKETQVLPEFFAGYVPISLEFEDPRLESATSYLCQMQPMAGMTLSWTISGENIFMQQSLETSVAEAWHSVGFTNVSPYNMGYADYVVSLFADYAGKYSGVRDLYKYDAGNHYPCWDVLQQCSLDGRAGTQDLHDRLASRSQGVSTSSWYRLLDTGDYKDSPITDALQHVMFAYGVNDEFTYHGIDARQTCTVNFFTGDHTCPVHVGSSSASFV